MRLTDDGVARSDYDGSVGNPVSMSIASDSSSKDDSGSALSGSGASRHDLCWSDEKFNTRRTAGMARTLSQDSQSSENGSWNSDHSGSAACMNGSCHSTTNHLGVSHLARGTETRNDFGDSAPSSHRAGSYGFRKSGLIPDDPYSRTTDLSHSYDQSMMVHIIRKQKALAHYYELLENGTSDNNNYKNCAPPDPDGGLRDRPNVAGNSPHRLSSARHSYHRRDSAPDVVARDFNRTLARSLTPSRISGSPNWKQQVENLAESPTPPPSYLFYLPVNVPYTDYARCSGSRAERLPHLEIYRNDNAGDNYSTEYPSPRTISGSVVFQTGALSADFGTRKVPDFPCHRAALGEEICNPDTPIQTSAERGLLNNRTRHGQVTPEHGGSARKSLSAAFGLISVGDDRVASPTKSNQSPGSCRPRARARSPAKSISGKNSSNFRGLLKRSLSAPNHLDQWTDDDDDEPPSCDNDDDGDDDDDDDYGFLSHPGFRHVLGTGGKAVPSSPNGGNKTSGPLSTGMQKAKSPATARRILPRRWRRVKNASKHVSVWKPEGGCVWSCKNGRRLTLSPVSVLTLTEVERVGMKKLAQAKLQALNLGCPIPIPKDWNRDKRSKKSTFSSLRKRTASTSAIESLKSKDNKEFSGVFGIPLGKCIAIDQELRRRKSSNIHGEYEDTPTLTPRHARKSSRTSATTSSESLSESGTRDHGSSLLDALSLSSSSPLDPHLDNEGSSLAVHIPQVPCIVTICCKHLETYGLRVLGIFRIGSSKKRSKQLREEIDSCREINLNESHNPHDVAALLKEYFRDLPDPLFTRDLYSVFIATRKIKDGSERLRALTLLLSLLPTPNRDTLWALLRFLNVVVQHSTDVITETGQLLPGNKMDSTNLATLFGPNLLHKAKGGEFQVESIDRAEERKEIISVIKELIDHQEAAFKLQPDIQDELYRRLLETNPEALDHIMKRRALSVPRAEIEYETSTSSLLDDSEGSSMPHSPGYSSENDLGYPRSFAEAMQLCSAEPQPAITPTSPHLQLRGAPNEGPAVYQTAPSPLATPKVHASAGRARSDNAPQDNRHLHVPANYRLSAPDTCAWYHSDRSASPASPRISPSPKAMKTDTPELRIRVTKSESPDKCLQAGSATNPSCNHHHHQGRRSVGVPHGPGPGGHRSKPRNTLTVPVPCSRSKSTESCSSVGSSSGYQGGSSRSGTNSPMTPDGSSAGHKRWYLETPPESPKDGCPSSPFQRTSSTHRPLGFSVPDRCSASPSPNAARNDRSAPSATSSSSAHAHAVSPVRPTTSSASVQWQKERWCHWEKLTKQHGEEQQEQETLV